MVIFSTLMKIFRTHIIQNLSACLLLAGMFFYFLKPASSNTDDDAFASWLKTNLKTGNNAEVIDQIQQLSHSGSEIESVIRKASSLVKNHADDFTLPVAQDDQDENEVFQVLLKEWNDFQNSASGMGKAVIIKQAQPYTVLPIDGIAFASKAFKKQFSELASPEISEIFFIRPPAVSYHISPLTGGTAIGAP